MYSKRKKCGDIRVARVKHINVHWLKRLKTFELSAVRLQPSMDKKKLKSVKSF